jgi:methionyl-tRNA formyltransferase
LRVGFAGTAEFALPALAALLEHHEVVGVLTRPDRPAGRGRHLRASAVKVAAEAQRLPLAQPARLDTEAARAPLASWHPQVLVVAAYGLILPREVLELPPLGCINIHGSLLPRWRGAAPIERALLAGDRETGVTLIRMDSGLDTGPMLLQQRIAIRSDATAGSLRDELAALGAAALTEALEGLALGRLSARPQPSEGVTYARKLEKHEGHIDWSRDAFDIDRQIRAFNPRPVAETTLGEEPLRIFAARPVDERESADKVPASAGKISDPGAIIAIEREAMIVQCGRGRLAVTELQRPGRRRMSARELSQGLELVGRRLG